MGREKGTGYALEELRVRLAAMQTREELADPAVRTHVKRYLESAESEIEYLAALRDRASFVRLDDHREPLATERAVRAVRLAEAKIDAAVAEMRGDARAEAAANRRAAELIAHIERERGERPPVT
jgi:hypothetical protein